MSSLGAQVIIALFCKSGLYWIWFAFHSAIPSVIILFPLNILKQIDSIQCTISLAVVFMGEPIQIRSQVSFAVMKIQAPNI